MILDRYSQQPAEVRRRQIDYGEWLDTDEIITDVANAISPVTVPPLALTSVTIDPTGKIVEYFASGGLTGTDYTVTITITTDDGQVREDELDITVEEFNG
jgi:hypothetical protein